MNSEPVAPTNTVETETLPASPDLVEPLKFAPELPRTPRPHDKIAKLPKILRDQLNNMLDNGFTYNRIIETLQQSTDPPLPYSIAEMDISRWKNRGYQIYLAQQERLAMVRENREAAMEMVTAADTTTLPEAALQIIASQYYDILGGFSPESLKLKLGEDPLKYTRFLNVFARLTREIVNLKKHRENSAIAATAHHKKSGPNNKPSTPTDDKSWLDRADDLFGFKSAERLKQDLSSVVLLTKEEAMPSPSHPSQDKEHQSPETELETSPPKEDLSSEVLLTKEEVLPPSSIKHPASRNPKSSVAPPAPSIKNPENGESKIENQNSTIDRCHSCHTNLPPLLPNGDRPFDLCQRCGTALHSPHNSHRYCPSCGSDLRIIIVGNDRIFPTCPCCNAQLPPWLPPKSD